MNTVACIVIGGGAIGLAVARRMVLGGIETIVLERESAPGCHASSRNSEVVHAGIYYPPGSLKAQLCVRGREQLYRYCGERGIEQRRCGKLIVAVSDDERTTLDLYRRNAELNGVADLHWLASAAVRELEPEVHCRAALCSPSTGILDSHAYLQSLLGDVERAGGVLALRTEAVRGRLQQGGHRIAVRQAGIEMEFEAKYVVNAAGFDAQLLARRLEGLDARSIPPRHLAKGHYFNLQGRSPFGGLVYPVESPGGLGIHATLDLSGAVRFGPDVEWVDCVDYATDERRRASFAAAIRNYYPNLDEERLQPAYTGIRSKVAGPGAAAADFMIQGPESHGWEGLVNLYGMESPGLTASLAIADVVAGKLGLSPDAAEGPARK